MTTACKSNMQVLGKAHPGQPQHCQVAVLVAKKPHGMGQPGARLCRVMPAGGAWDCQMGEAEHFLGATTHCSAPLAVQPGLLQPSVCTLRVVLPEHKQ